MGQGSAGRGRTPASGRTWRSAALAAGLAGLVAAPAPLRAQSGAPPPPPVNPASVDIRLTPSDVAVGTTFAFKVTTRQAGYLVLLDVNAEGAVAQLYPNVFSMKMANQPVQAGDPCAAPGVNTLSSYGLQDGGSAKSNRIEAGQSFELPGSRDGATYAFQACPPKGGGMAVAVLSDKPVQIIDLPDIPAAVVGQPAGFERLVAALQALRLVSSGQAAGPAAAPRWSVAWTPYTIR